MISLYATYTPKYLFWRDPAIRASRYIVAFHQAGDILHRHNAVYDQIIHVPRYKSYHIA